MHVAIIMDGSGRWAASRGLPRSAGHRAGVQAVRRTVEAALSHGIETLTLFAFSTDNWHRPASEVSALMEVFADYLRDEMAPCAEKGVRLRLIGRRDRLAPELLAAVEAAEIRTAAGTSLRLRLAIDYSGRDAIVRAVRRLLDRDELSQDGSSVGPADHGPGSSTPPAPSPADHSRGPAGIPVSPTAALALCPDLFSRLLGEVEGDYAGSPDVDFLIRTGGERRLSDFSLWECAYAEMLFTKTMWPDFDAEHFTGALDEYRGRDRRFGRLSQAAVTKGDGCGADDLGPRFS